MVALSTLALAGCGGDGSRVKDAEGTAAQQAGTVGLVIDEFTCRDHPGLEGGNGTVWFLCSGAVQGADGVVLPGTMTVACADSGPCRVDW